MSPLGVVAVLVTVAGIAWLLDGLRKERRREQESEAVRQWRERHRRKADAAAKREPTDGRQW